MSDAVAKNMTRTAPPMTAALNVPPRLAELWRRGAEFLGCKLAILAGGPGWASGRDQVTGGCNPRGFRVIAGDALRAGFQDGDRKRTHALMAQPLGVDLLPTHPALIELVAVC